MKLKLALAGALLAFGFAIPSFAAPAFSGHGGFVHKAKPASWELVGQWMVGPRVERDVIPVLGRERHRQIMLCVYNRPVRVNDFDVRFKNGAKQDVAVRSVIGAGQCTRAIDLKGQKRNIKSIALAHKTVGFGRGALVKIFAR